MSRQLLVIEGDDRQHFFLALEDGTLAVSADPQNGEVVLRDLHIRRIRCEIEVEDDRVVVGKETSSGAPVLRQDLHPGEAFHLGQAHFSLQPVPADPADAEEGGKPAGEALAVEPAPAPVVASHPAAPQATGKRLVVIDGADQGRAFRLPDAGRVTIGTSPKHADIVLHDLYVARLHCSLDVDGDDVVVTHVQGTSGTRINGQAITQQDLRLGDVLRVGNSHLHFEIGVVEDAPPAKADEDSGTFSVAGETAAGAAAAKAVLGAGGGAEPRSLPPSVLDQLLQLENQVLGPYRIGALLGRGQTSLVFRAEGINNHLAVALKVLSPEFPAGDEQMQRFVRTLKVVAPFRHAHLVSLYGAGKSGPYCWIAREFVDGESLARQLPRLKTEEKLGWKRACRVAIHLGKALELLHENRVTHGNLTPANVLIASSTRATKLADALLDKALEGSRLQKVLLDDRLLPELPFRAPEQLEAGVTVDHRADLYALGAVLYALLTGLPPYSGATPREVLGQIREGKPVKPTKILRETPAPFETAVLKMMARHPEDRYQTATEMLADVEPIAHMHEIKV
jgi:hypothetical protein